MFLAFWLLSGAKHTILYDFPGTRLIDVSWKNHQFRQIVRRFILKKIGGDRADQGLGPALMRFPPRLMRFLGRAALSGIEKVTARVCYGAFCLYLLAFGKEKTV